MAGRKLDKQRDYGTIHGDPDGRQYEQDGVVFNAQGNEWAAPVTKSDVEIEAEQAAARIAEEAARDQAVAARVAAILAEKGLGPDGKPLAKPSNGKGKGNETPDPSKTEG